MITLLWCLAGRNRNSVWKFRACANSFAAFYIIICCTYCNRIHSGSCTVSHKKAFTELCACSFCEGRSINGINIICYRESFAAWKAHIKIFNINTCVFDFVCKLKCVTCIDCIFIKRKWVCYQAWSWTAFCHIVTCKRKCLRCNNHNYCKYNWCE